VGGRVTQLAPAWAGEPPLNLDVRRQLRSAMAKRRPPPGRCVHCLRDHEVLTWDHVFPEAWYPESTPANVEKWKIPACEPCNAAHGRSENYLLVRLGLCIEPEDSDTAHFNAKALRALTANAAHSQKDAAARNAEREKIFSQAVPAASGRIPPKAIYPGFGPKPGADLMALPVRKKPIVALTEKIVRGITYLQDRRFIEPPHKINFYALSEEQAARINEVLAQFGQTYERGLALTVDRAVTHEDGISSVYRIEIWSRLCAYAIVSDPTSTAAA
jgi:hypothetical protein